MRKNLINYFFALTTVITVSACGNTAGSTGATPKALSNTQSQLISDSSFFDNNSVNQDYPKVHPKFYNKKYPVTVIGHRGYRMVAPENTLASFKKAYQAGADMIELDVHLSKDGQVIVMHDDTLDRTTNGKGPIGNKTLAELKELDAGTFFSPVFKGEKLPTLEEVFQFAKGKVSVNVEIKKEAVSENAKDGIEKKVADMIANSGMADYIMVCSFSELALERIKEINPNISTGLLIVSEGLFRSQVTRVSKVKADAIHEFGKFLSKSDIKKSHQHDIHENSWTVNDPHKMSQLINNGVDGLITDRPDLALKVLEEKYPTN